MDVMENLVGYLEKFIGRPYIWAGNGSGKCFGGFDCSGLVLEGLWAFGLYHGMDTTAEGLRTIAVKNWKPSAVTARGAIVFFGANGKATHVALCIGGGFMLEAGGAGSDATSPEKSAGMVRIRPVDTRRGVIAAYMPNY